jgi:phospholipid/cholesterol/gamma-HCH transport system substrate-binding protein
MKRIGAIALVVGCAIIVAVVAMGASGDGADGSGGTYEVRAIFDSAFGVIPGEDVKVAGVKVGSIDSLHVTDDKRAAVVLAIDKPGFGDFRSDANCIIRPQSLIGEKFVDCTPTQPRQQDTPAPPPLKRIRSGPGKGQYLLPVSNTSKSVDLDLINDIYQLPERERLTIILNELGTGLAGRGKDLNDVIRRADPALAETDKVLAILKEQNQTLANLATESDTVLAPLAQRKEQVADFIVKARNVSQATAQERGALAQNLRKLPTFLTQLRPTLAQLGNLSDQMTPVLTDLGSQADNINRFVTQIGPLASAARPAVKSLGQASVVGTQAMQDIRPITSDVNELASSAQPLASNLSDLLVSLRDTGGVERAMDYLFFQMTAINGFDTAGHYLRAALLINTCSSYAIEKTIGCEATFSKVGDSASTRSTVDDSDRSLYLKRQDALMGGMSLEDVLRTYPDPTDDAATAQQTAAVKQAQASSGSSSAAQPAISMPSSVLPGSATTAPVQEQPSTPAADPAAQGTTTTTTTPAADPAATAAGSSSTAPSSASASAPSDSTTSRLLDYLLGGGG